MTGITKSDKRFSHNSLLQNVTGITKSDKRFSHNSLLQNVTGITKSNKRFSHSVTGTIKCDNYYKVRSIDPQGLLVYIQIIHKTM